MLSSVWQHSSVTAAPSRAAPHQPAASLRWRLPPAPRLAVERSSRCRVAADLQMMEPEAPLPQAGPCAPNSGVGLDMVALRGAVEEHHLSQISMPGLHALSTMDQIKVGVAYLLPDGTSLTSTMDSTHMTLDTLASADVEVVYETVPGWLTDISGVQRWEELPEAAKRFVRWVEQAAGVRCVSVGTSPDSAAPLVAKPEETPCWKDPLAACTCECGVLDDGH